MNKLFHFEYRKKSASMPWRLRSVRWNSNTCFFGGFQYKCSTLVAALLAVRSFLYATGRIDRAPTFRGSFTLRRCMSCSLPQDKDCPLLEFHLLDRRIESLPSIFTLVQFHIFSQLLRTGMHYRSPLSLRPLAVGLKAQLASAAALRRSGTSLRQLRVSL